MLDIIEHYRWHLKAGFCISLYLYREVYGLVLVYEMLFYIEKGLYIVEREFDLIEKHQYMPYINNSCEL